MNKKIYLIIALILAIPTFGLSILIYSIFNDLHFFEEKEKTDEFFFEITLINALSKKND